MIRLGIISPAFIANTDFGWFSHFRHHTEPPDEVDFWQPSPHGFKAIPAGAPFFFRVGAPHSAIAAGFNFFERYERVPAWLGWGLRQQERHGHVRRDDAAHRADPGLRGQRHPAPRSQCHPRPSHRLQGRVHHDLALGLLPFGATELPTAPENERARSSECETGG